MTWKPWTFFAVALAGWMNRQQQQVIQYLPEENHTLREKLAEPSVWVTIENKRSAVVAGKRRLENPGP
jgi:hypothetical protein